MNKMSTAEKKRERLRNVINFLTECNIEINEIEKKFDVNDSDISNMLKGKTINIPDEIIEKFRQHYCINPGYILGIDNEMLCHPGTILKQDVQAKMFDNVITYLMECRKKNSDIAKNLGRNDSDISNMRKGKKIKHIPDEVLIRLHEHYNINPSYIREGVGGMFDVPSIKYNNFNEFVTSWDLVEYEEKSYLHFTMDAQFYDFLIELYNQQELTQAMNSEHKKADALKKTIEALKKNFSPVPNNKEYVLIPADDVLEIVENNAEIRKKNLNEVLNVFDIGYCSDSA